MFDPCCCYVAGTHWCFSPELWQPVARELYAGLQAVLGAARTLPTYRGHAYATTVRTLALPPRLSSGSTSWVGSSAGRTGWRSGWLPMGRGRLACTAAAPPAAKSAVRACGGLQRWARRRRSVACLIPAGGGAGQRRTAAGWAEASAVSACRLGRYAVAAAVAGAARGTEGFDTGTLAPRRSTVRPIYFTHSALGVHRARHHQELFALSPCSATRYARAAHQATGWRSRRSAATSTASSPSSCAKFSTPRVHSW